MLAAVKGILQGNTVVIENEDLKEYEGAEVIVTLLNPAQEQKSNKKTLKEIQSLFADDKGWDSEEDMIKDMAQFRKERMTK